MRNLIVWYLKKVCNLYQGHKETKELKKRLERKTEEFRNRCEQETEELRRLSDLFLKDIKVFTGDGELEEWKQKILDVCMRGLYVYTFEKDNEGVRNEVYATLKEYEKWRIQKLR